jgi:hypothetical protein
MSDNNNTQDRIQHRIKGKLPAGISTAYAAAL